MANANQGLVNPAPVIAYDIDTGVTEAGYLVKLTTTAGHVDVCGAGEAAIGYTYTNTIPATMTTAVTGKVGVAALIPGHEAYIQLLYYNTTIAVGDALETAPTGAVDKKSGGGYVVGYALEAKAISAGGTIRVRIQPCYFAA